jgi:LacI family transcriptional regulator
VGFSAVANIQQVARAAGVSTATVSRYFAGLSVRSHEAIAHAVTLLDYTPSPVARSLKSGRHHAIGVIVPDVTNPFFAALVKGIESEARGSGFELILGNSDEDAAIESSLVATISQRVDGLIIAPVVEDDAAVASFIATGSPAVLVDRDVVADGRVATDAPRTVDRVLVDNAAGAALAVEHLAGLGHKAIAVISGPLDSTPGRARHAGFLEEMLRLGLPVRDELVRVADFREEGGYTAMAELVSLTEAPTAVFVANNLMAIGALRLLNDRKIPVPGTISVIGFDDLSFAPLLNPPLSVIRRPDVLQGATAARLLLRRLLAKPGEDILPERLSLPVELVIRGSTSLPPNPEGTR